MSRIRANTIVNGAGTGAPNFPRGAIISGISTINAEISVGTGTSISSPATNELALGTNDVERLRITSTGLVGIGTDSPSASAKLQVIGDTSYIARFQRAGSGGFAAIEIKAGNNTGNSRIYFADPDSVDVGEIEYEHADDSMRFTTGGSEAARFNSSGNLAFPSGQGIDFSATSDGSGTMTSELLDDYEEGTWTPTDHTGGRTFGGTTWGYYTKIGRQVTVSSFVDALNSNVSNPSTIFTVGGLPYTPLDPGTGGFVGAVMLENVDVETTTYNLSSFTTDATGGIRFYKSLDNTGWDGILNSEVTSATNIYFSLTYFTT